MPALAASAAVVGSSRPSGLAIVRSLRRAAPAPSSSAMPAASHSTSRSGQNAMRSP
jgi:hypothetical protein